MIIERVERNRRNEAIAKMMGWYQDDINPDTWMVSTDNARVVAYSMYKNTYNGLPFNNDYEYIMKVFDWIRSNVSTNGNGVDYYIEYFDIRLETVSIMVKVRVDDEWVDRFSDKDLSINYYMPTTSKSKFIDILFMAFSDLALVLKKYDL